MLGGNSDETLKQINKTNEIRYRINLGIKKDWKSIKYVINIHVKKCSFFLKWKHTYLFKHVTNEC